VNLTQNMIQMWIFASRMMRTHHKLSMLRAMSICKGMGPIKTRMMESRKIKRRQMKRRRMRMRRMKMRSRMRMRMMAKNLRRFARARW
jgi:hypothetical protein